MKRRNTKIKDFQVNSGSKILSAKFGNQSKSVIVSGDDKNNINLWKITKDKPLIQFNHNSANSHQIEVTAVQFNFNDTVLYTGTNRGIINVWDIESQKLSFTLKGHSGGINTLSVFPYEDQRNLLISGSFDTNIKVWDLRTKDYISMLKGHTMLVNCLAGSPDGKIVASGGSDSQVRLWDIGQGKCVTTFTLHDSSVTCIKFNPVEMALASASADRTVKYYDLDTFQLISSTKLDATPVQQILFNDEGNVLFSAAHESLKVWNLDKDGLLLDNVESQWRGVQDMQIADADEMLLGITSYQQSFALWACPLKLINMDSDNAVNTNQRAKTSQNQQPPINSQKNFLPSIDSNKGKSPQDENKYGKIHGTENMLPPNQRSYSEVHAPHQYNFDMQQGYPNQYPNALINPHIIQTKIDSFPILPTISNNSSHHHPHHEFIKQQSQEQIGSSYVNQQQNNQNRLSPKKSPQILDAALQNHYANDDQMLFKKKTIDNQEDEAENQAIIDQQYEKLNNESKIYNQRLPPKEQIKIGSNLSSSSSKEEIEEDIESEKNKKNKIQSKNAIDKNQEQQQIPLEMDASSLTILDSMASTFNFNNVNAEQQQLLKQIDFISDLSKEHQKFFILMSTRLNYIKPIQHWWNQGNSKSSLYAISQLFDPCYVMDALQMTCNMNRLQHVSVEGVGVLLQKCKILIESKYQSHIKFGLEFVKKILDQYKDEVINIKTFVLMSKVDLAREERIKKFNSLIDELRQISKISRIKKIVERKPKEDIGQLAILVLNDLNYFFSKIDGVQQN